MFLAVLSGRCKRQKKLTCTGLQGRFGFDSGLQNVCTIVWFLARSVPPLSHHHPKPLQVLDTKKKEEVLKALATSVFKVPVSQVRGRGHIVST